MHAVAVRRLALRVPSGQLAASRQRAEDALFLAAPDETRLLLLRRLDLGRLPAGAPADTWTARAAERLAERRARAVHGAQPGAEAAEAVWFRSIDEARQLLLLLLAGGRQPTAWFWRLAVPEWRGLSLPSWMADRLASAVGEPAVEVALAGAVLMATRAGRLPAIAAALAAATLPEMAGAAAGSTTLAADSGHRAALRLAPVLLARLDGPTRQAISRTIAGLPAQAQAARWLVRLALVAVAPELAGQVATLTALAEVVIAKIRAAPPVPTDTAPADIRPAATAETADATPPMAAQNTIATIRRSPMPGDVPQTPGAPPFPVAEAPFPPSAPSPGAASTAVDAEEEILAEQASGGVGVLLAIRALDRLGLGTWLARDTDAAAAGFGRHLLHHISVRARLPSDDPLVAALAAPDPSPPGDMLQAWRAGLDRWLRRRVRLRLSELARRRGWLHLTDDTLLVRFPLEAADLRLRRLALDADPGWVPWLGLAVRYHYRDTPLA